MEIDYHSQSRYSPGKFPLFIEMDGKFIRETSFPEIENVIRDTSYARHQSANFLSLYGAQFDFERMLNLPYWEFVFVKGDINKSELEDIQEGCLLIIALMHAEIYDDSGSCYIYSHKLFDKVGEALELFIPPTEKLKVVVEKIKLLRKYADDDGVFHRVKPGQGSINIQKELVNSNQFLYKELVEDYFWRVANGFESLRQQSASRLKQPMDQRKESEHKKRGVD